MGIVSILTLHRDVHEEHIVKAVEHYCDGVIRMTHTALEDKEQAEMLQIRKVPGMSLSELENTDFIFRPSPGHIELTPFM
jgi:archaellum biogenesis ATPase FlaH